jgi:deoxyribodipyrimidine photo-lyase
MYNIIWFKNDLRTLDNSALSAAMYSKPLYPVRAVFFITEQQWQAHNWGFNKISFVMQSVLVLEEELKKLNIILDILICQNFKLIPQALLEYLQNKQAVALYYNKEYELDESSRDIAVEKLVANNKIAVNSFHDQTLIAPGRILTKQKTPYTVFTPFKTACYAYLYDNPLHLPSKLKSQNLNDKVVLRDIAVDSLINKYINNPILAQWPVGQQHALKLLKDFCNNGINNYKDNRDFPSLTGTSKLSAYFAVGAISVRSCFVAAVNVNNQEFAGGNANISCWISELLWRDFYKQIIFHFPNLCKGENFNHKYDKMPWLEPGNNLLLWQQGKTGIPIIDAAMRQLVATGWMHNRLRMIVAMFLTKNLLIDWRHGELFFSKHLVDLDFASNNGGWQWSASTGTDAVPYFRIFNPVAQSKKFDPQGSFIKKFCPELQSLDSKQIHDPSASLTAIELKKLGYPEIMVNLPKSRLRALEYFKTK